MRYPVLLPPRALRSRRRSGCGSGPRRSTRSSARRAAPFRYMFDDTARARVPRRGHDSDAISEDFLRGGDEPRAPIPYTPREPPRRLLELTDFEDGKGGRLLGDAGGAAAGGAVGARSRRTGVAADRPPRALAHARRAPLVALPRRRPRRLPARARDIRPPARVARPRHRDLVAQGRREARGARRPPPALRVGPVRRGRPRRPRAREPAACRRSARRPGAREPLGRGAAPDQAGRGQGAHAEGAGNYGTKCPAETPFSAAPLGSVAALVPNGAHCGSLSARRAC